MVTAPGEGPEIPTAQEALVVHPGDVLILRFDRKLTEAFMHELKVKVLERLPMLEDVVIVANCQQLAVVRTRD